MLIRSLDHILVVRSLLNLEGILVPDTVPILASGIRLSIATELHHHPKLMEYFRITG